MRAVNRPTRFGVTALLLFALIAVAGVLAAPSQDATAVIYLFLAIVVPVPIAYFLVYLGGLDRLTTEESSTSSERTGADRAAQETDVESDRDSAER
jgi:hypothetical protein